MIAHIAGLPIEEVVPALMSGVSAWSMVRLSSRLSRLRAKRRGC